jgi:hypothetical protein
MTSSKSIVYIAPLVSEFGMVKSTYDRGSFPSIGVLYFVAKELYILSIFIVGMKTA